MYTQRLSSTAHAFHMLSDQTNSAKDEEETHKMERFIEYKNI